MIDYKPTVRDPYTQQVSLKIGASLERFFTELAQKTGVHVNIIYRDALTHFSQQLNAAERINQQEVIRGQDKKIVHLEEELRSLRLSAQPAQVAVKPPSEVPISNKYWHEEASQSGAFPPQEKPLDAPLKTSEESVAHMLEAFGSTNVVRGIREVARLVEEGNIDFERSTIVEHFNGYCPDLKSKRVQEAIECVATHVENGTVKYEAKHILSLFLTFMPQP